MRSNRMKLETKYYIYQNILGLIGVLIFSYLAYHWVEINEYISHMKEQIYTARNKHTEDTI